jgi:hypothetical protein
MTEHKAVDGKPEVEALRAEIRQTRAELGETVQQLAAKADVKARMKEQAAQTKIRMKESAAQTAAQVRDSAGHVVERAKHSLRRGPGSSVDGGEGAPLPAVAREKVVAAGESVRQRPVPWLAVAGGAAALIVLLIIRRRRR